MNYILASGLGLQVVATGLCTGELPVHGCAKIDSVVAIAWDKGVGVEMAAVFSAECPLWLVEI